MSNMRPRLPLYILAVEKVAKPVSLSPNWKAILPNQPPYVSDIGHVEPRATRSWGQTHESTPYDSVEKYPLDTVFLASGSALS